MSTLVDKLREVAVRHAELERLLADPAVIADRIRFLECAKEHAELAPVVEEFGRYEKLLEEIEGHRELLDSEDEELAELAREELPALNEELTASEERLKILLLPKDPNDEKNTFLEIRAGTGGEEAALFAADLLRMYLRYAERKGWKPQFMSTNESGVGGYKEVIVLFEGRGVYSRLKFEAGVHRVQRVPATESQGRIHTSAVTVAVLPEADEVEVALNPNDLRIDVYRSSGPGGQSVNTTDSAVRVTHLPTGLTVAIQDEKSQHKNKDKALKVLKAQLLAKMEAEQAEEISQTRRGMVGSGDRSEKIRTYNFPQSRVTDHRIGFTSHKMDQILDGSLDEIIDLLITHHQAEFLKGG